jgi:hypothetical protein
MQRTTRAGHESKVTFSTGISAALERFLCFMRHAGVSSFIRLLFYCHEKHLNVPHAPMSMRTFAAAHHANVSAYSCCAGYTVLGRIVAMAHIIHYDYHTYEWRYEYVQLSCVASGGTVEQR